MIGKAVQAAQSTKEKQQKNAKQGAKQYQEEKEKKGEVKSNCFLVCLKMEDRYECFE